MKRLFAVLMVVSLVVGAAFAQLSFNVQVGADIYGTNGFQFGNQMTQNAMGDWGFGDNATLFNLGFSTEKAGVSVDIRPSATNGIYVHNYSGWFKPIDMLKVSLGTNVAVNVFDSETIRWNCLGARAGEVTGAAVELTPIDGLYLGYVIAAGTANDDNWAIDETKMGAAGAFTLDGFGKIAAQWTTSDNGIASGTNALGAGVGLSLLDGVLIEPVYTIFLYGDDDDYKYLKGGILPELVAYDPMHKIDLYVTFGADALSVKLLERLYIRTTEDYNDIGNVVKAEVNYNVTENVGVNLKAAWAMNAGTGNDDWDGGFGQVFYDKGNNVAFCLTLPITFDAGVTIQPGFMLNMWSPDADDAESKTTWAIPLTLKYSF